MPMSATILGRHPALLHHRFLVAAARTFTPTRMARASSIGLFAVLIGVSLFAMVFAISTGRASERAIASITLSDHYSAASSAVALEESLERKYRLEPGRVVRQNFDDASAKLQAAMALVRRDGSAPDLRVAELVDLGYGPYQRAIDEMFRAVDRGDAAMVLHIDSEDVDPRFDLIENLVHQAADDRRATALADLAELKRLEAATARLTPVVFLIGFVFVAFFSAVLGRTRAQLTQQRTQAVHDALHDSLTGLPNRTLLADRFGQALIAGIRTSATTGLLLVDLDRFKEINDTLGHAVGDKLLTQVGPRLEGALRSADTIARLGGDEFAVLLPTVDGLDGAMDVAARLRAALARPFLIGDVELDVDGSIGLVVSGLHGRDAETLMQRAEVAMYVAKHQRTGIFVYDPDTDDHSLERLSLLGELRRGIERGELFLQYQPKIELKTNEGCGCRGPSSLATSGTRSAPSRHLHSARRAHRNDRAAHAFGPGHGPDAGTRMGRCRATRPGRRQYLRAQPGRQEFFARGQDLARPARGGRDVVGDRGHRVCSDA